MEAVLNGLGAQAKTGTHKEAIGQAKEALKNVSDKKDTPLSYVREKLLNAFELAFEQGNEKGQHYAVEGLQALIRDRRFHSKQTENPQDGLPAQVLHSMNSISHWNHQVQCHCLTVIVELICSVELKITVVELQSALELCMRAFGGSKEESARMSARAAISQSISSYCSNRYNRCEEPTEFIAVYLDATALLEGYVAKLDQLTLSSEQSLVLFDATNALLAAQPLSIQQHQPFLNLLWEKLCPLMIRFLGVPDKNTPRASPIPSERSATSTSVDEPMGQGQMARFALSPAVMANPEATRALYLIVEQLLRLMCSIQSLHSVLEALFHKAFLFPKIEHRSEAIKIIRKMLSDPKRLGDLMMSASQNSSLSLWRMLIVCLSESSNPQYDVSIEAVRACSSMLQGLLDFCEKESILSDEARAYLRKTFPKLKDITATGFLASTTIRESTDELTLIVDRSRTETVDSVVISEADDEVSDCLQRLQSKLNADGKVQEKSATPARLRREMRESRASDSVFQASEAATAARFVTALFDAASTWHHKGTLAVDEEILKFATKFHTDFSATHHDLFRRKALVQQEFLNTDALYLSIYATLSLIYRGENEITWETFRDSILGTGCVVYASETWLKQVYELATLREPPDLPAVLVDLIKDYDGLDCEILSEVLRLKRIQVGAQKRELFEERLAARWLICSAWESVVCILNTFLGVKERRKARQKVLDGVEHSIQGMQRLATVAMKLELGERCGWIFESLVEASCDVDELRVIASAEEQKRLSIVSRTDLLSMQLVLDHAFVANFAPDCWKHVIRCTEYVWELEKFIYGALCYEKPPTRHFFTWKKEKEVKREEEGISAADRSVEMALGERPLDKDNINKALCVLIAKTDRFYASIGRELSLPSLKSLLQSLVSASLARTLYPSLAQPHSPSLTTSSSLIGRLSECLSCLHSRPISHQMLVWPIASRHLIEVACGSEDDSRASVNALSESTRALLAQEGAGSCFNQMLIQSFQTIVCSDRCSTETRGQLVETLSEFVHTKADRLGSGWKPLFGALRAVRTADGAEEGLHWTVLDVIGTYLRLNKCSVLSWSMPDCLPCIVHFLQETKTSTFEHSAENQNSNIEEQLSAAALKLVTPCYNVIQTSYTTTHLPNHNLLHKMELRISSSEQVESSLDFLSSNIDLVSPLSASLDPTFYLLRPDDPFPSDMDKILDVPLGPPPWEEQEPHKLAAIELLLELVEQLAGVLVTAPVAMQAPLLSTLQELIATIRKSEFGPGVAAFCVSSLILPHIQKWMRRSIGSKETTTLRNMRHAIGICAQIAVDFIQQNPGGAWEVRLLSDALRLACECAAQPSDASRVGAACLRHFETVFPYFEFPHWTIFAKGIWDTCTVTLFPLRLLLSFFVPDSNDENGDIGEVLVEGAGPLSHTQRMLAERVFLVDAQRDPTARLSVSDEEAGEMSVILVKNERKHRLPVSQLVYSLLAHQVVLQLIVALLSPEGEPPEVLKGALQPGFTSYLSAIPNHIRASLYHCLDASFQAARDLDCRAGARTLLARVLRLKEPNLFGQMVISGAGKFHSLHSIAKQRLKENDSSIFIHMTQLLMKLCEELERLEKSTARKRIAAETREHRDEVNTQGIGLFSVFSVIRTVVVLYQ